MNSPTINILDSLIQNAVANYNKVIEGCVQNLLKVVGVALDVNNISQAEYDLSEKGYRLFMTKEEPLHAEGEFRREIIGLADVELMKTIYFGYLLTVTKQDNSVLTKAVPIMGGRIVAREGELCDEYR